MALTLNGSGTIGGLSAYQSGAGLTLIAESTFTAASSVSVDDCFTSAYDNYRIVVSGVTASASPSVSMRLRVAGVDDTAAVYARQHLYGSGAVAGAALATAQTAWIDYMQVYTTAPTWADGTIFGPALASATGLTSWTTRSDSGAMLFGVGCRHTAATAYDGLTIYPASGTFTGTVRIYGYTNGA